MKAAVLVAPRRLDVRDIPRWMIDPDMVRVKACGVCEKPLAVARQAGITVALDARKTDPVAALPAANGGAGLDAVVDTVGTGESLRQGHAPGSERVLRTSSNSLFRDYQTALDLTASGRVKTAAMVTHRFPLDRVNEAFDVLFDKERTGAVKAIILP